VINPKYTTASNTRFVTHAIGHVNTLTATSTRRTTPGATHVANSLDAATASSVHPSTG